MVALVAGRRAIYRRRTNAAPPWTPAQVGSKVRSWFRPDGLAGAGGALLAGWARVGSGSSVFSQGDPAHQPTRVTMGGLDAVQLVDASDHFTTNTPSILYTTVAGSRPREVWAAFRLNAAPTTTQAPGGGYLNHAVWASGDQNEGIHVRNLSGIPQVQAYAWSGSTTIGSLEVPVTVGGLIRVRMTVAVGQLGLAVNGGSLATSSQTVTSAAGFARIGGSNGTSNSCPMTIGEIITTDPLTTEEADLMMTYLNRWQ